MSRSTFTFDPYSVTGSTSVVEVVCGFLLKELKGDRSEFNPMMNEVVEQLQDCMNVDYGFVRIELPKLKDYELKYLIGVISGCVVWIQSWGSHIPLDEVKMIQRAGFLLKQRKYAQDMPTYYILDYLHQLKRMLELSPDHDLSEENRSTNYPIVKE